MAAPSQPRRLPPKPPPDQGDWVQTLAARLDAFKEDFEATTRGEDPSTRLTGAQKFRGQGLVYEPDVALPSDPKELHELRYRGSLAASFIPQRHIGWVHGRPVMVFGVDTSEHRFPYCLIF